MNKSTTYWFPAKRFGWGWGLPCAWQGWFVFLGFIVLLIAVSVLFPPVQKTWAFIGCTIVLCGAFLGICVAKGEPLRRGA